MLDVRESPLQMIHSVSKKGTGKFTWEAGVKKKKEFIYQGLNAANEFVEQK